METNTSELKNLLKELEKKEVKVLVAQRREWHLNFLQSWGHGFVNKIK